MTITTTIISIYALTLLASAVKKIWKIPACPPCVGVAGTWLWIIAGMQLRWLEAPDWQLIAAMLMGGSVVGIAFQLEKRLPQSRSPVVWKTLFVPIGFVVVWSFIASLWLIFGAAISFLIIASIFFMKKPHSEQGGAVATEQASKDLRSKLKSCC